LAEVFSERPAERDLLRAITRNDRPNKISLKVLKDRTVSNGGSAEKASLRDCT
jgi:hypothetical protein